MHNEFFYNGGLALDFAIKEISLIAPYYYKGTIESVGELYFKISENIFSKGFDIYIRYKSVLREALSLMISGGNYYYKNYNKRVLLNYAIGFLKLEMEKLKSGR